MKSDKSRDTFHPEKHYSSVRLQQGRVLTDADWNEEADIERHREEAIVRDMVGPTGVAEANDGFRAMGVMVTSTIADIDLKRGRMYVDGILVEQDVLGASYRNQPDLPPQGLPPIPTTAGSFAAYLDVWDRHIGSLEDPAIRETALGGPDTATRSKTVWQLKFLTLGTTTSSPPSPVEDVEATPEWHDLIEANTSTGAMRARARPEDVQADPCIIPQAAGFRRLENQLYRVEIHKAGTLGGGGGGTAPTFVWSRDNGSVLAQWLDVPDGVNQLRVSQPTRDEALGFAQGQWIELIDDTRELRGEAGPLVQILVVDGDLITYDPGTQTIKFSDFPTNPKVRRWDSPGAVTVARNTATNDGYIALESGVEVLFEDGSYRVGDYWMIPARTISGSIEWPADPADPTQPQALLATGIIHHLTPLASFTMPNFQLLVDTRKKFPALTELPTKGTEADTPPQPGQFRYYLVDGDGGDDLTGRPGIDFDPPTAFAEAVRFKTYTRVLQILPHDGSDSTAIILINPLASGDRYAPDFVLSGVHGYRRFMIRGSNLVNDDADFVNCAAVPIDEFPTGIKLLNQRVRPSDAFGYEFDFELLVDAATPLPADPNILNGTRARFISSNPSLDGFKTVVFRNEQVASDGVPNVIRILDTPSGNVNPGDTLMVERPGTRLNNFFVNDIACGFELIGLDIGAPFMGRMSSSLKADAPRGGVQFSFCRVGLMGIDGFDSVITEVNPRPDDLRFGDFNVGACLLVEEGGDFRNGKFVDLNHYVSHEGIFCLAVQQVNLFSGVVAGGSLFTNCGTFRIGSASFPHLAVLDTLLIGGIIGNSSGVLDHVFFNVVDQTFPSISISGARQALDILQGTVRRDHAGVTIDLSEASEANVFVFDPNEAFLFSGDSITLATGLVLAGNNLLTTNTVDFAGNRVRGSFGTLISGAWGTAIAGDVTNFDVVRVARFGDGDPQPKLVQAGKVDSHEVDLDVALSIFGVVQQTAVATNVNARPMVVASGFTLVNIASDQLHPSITFPTPIFLSPTEAGKITFEANGIRLGLALQFDNAFRSTVLCRLQLPVS
jgi:hypothetical protein